MLADDQVRDNTVPHHGGEESNLVDFEQLIHNNRAAQEDAESHAELDPTVFHPSSVGYDKWFILVKKLGLSDTSDLYGTFHTGQMIHESVQAALQRTESPRDTQRSGIESDVTFSEGSIPRSESEIPFDRPDNYFANTTDLDFSRFNGGEE